MNSFWTKKNTCRICLKNHDQLNSLDAFSDFIFVDVINTINNKLLSHTDVPDMCCKPCLESLKICQDFKLQCEASNKIMVKFYEKIPRLIVNLHLEDTLERNEDRIVALDHSDFAEMGGESDVDKKQRIIVDYQAEAICKKSMSPACIAIGNENNELIKKFDATLEIKIGTLSAQTTNAEKVGTDGPNRVQSILMTANLGSQVCSKCNFVAPYPSALERHLRSHFKRLSYSCEACAQVFPDMSSLDRHKSSHSEDAQFTCHECSQQFTFRSSLIRHMLAHAHSAEKPQCKTCNKSFSSKFDLLSHSKRHIKDGPFVCEICGKRRNSKHNLDIHKRVHSDRRQFSCKDCSFRTISCSVLQIHLRTHSGEKPFLCSKCEERFISGLQMTRHMIEKHKSLKLITH